MFSNFIVWTAWHNSCKEILFCENNLHVTHIMPPYHLHDITFAPVKKTVSINNDLLVMTYWLLKCLFISILNKFYIYFGNYITWFFCTYTVTNISS